MTSGDKNWEYDFWECLSKGDGAHCPLYYECGFRKQQGWCWDDFRDIKNQLLDRTHIDSLAQSLPKKDHGGFSKLSLPLELMASRYISEYYIQNPPVPTGLMNMLDTRHDLEVHDLKLKTLHGATWFFTNRWIVHLNDTDTRQMKRFTLFHEGFHILTQSHMGLTDNVGACERGFFIEGMADMFATCILIPAEWARNLWHEHKDVEKMATLFDVPLSAMWFRLRHLGLV